MLRGGITRPARGRAAGEETDRLLTEALSEAPSLAPETAQLLLRQALATAAARRAHGRRLAVAAWGLAAVAFVTTFCALAPWRGCTTSAAPPRGVRVAQAPRAPTVELADKKGQRPACAGSAAGNAARARKSVVTARDFRRRGSSRRTARRTRRHGQRRVRPAIVPRVVEDAFPPLPTPAAEEAMAKVAFPATGSLFVMVTAGHPEPLVTVRQATDETPGYARAAALRPAGEGGAVWTQATDTGDASGPELVLLALEIETVSP